MKDNSLDKTADCNNNKNHQYNVMLTKARLKTEVKNEKKGQKIFLHNQNTESVLIIEHDRNH